MLPRAHKFLLLFALILSLSLPISAFVQNDIQDYNEILSNVIADQSGTLQGRLGLVFDKFEPGTHFDINGANFTIGEQEIVVKPDQGLEDIKVGIEVIGNKAAVFGGWAPVGVIDNLPENEKIRVENRDNVVEIELQTNDDLTKTVIVDFNGEEVLHQGGEDQVIVFVEISEEEENLKVAYSDGVNTIKLTEDLRTGEISFDDIETESYEYEMDYIPGFEETLEDQTGAMIKQLTEEQLKQFENAKAISRNIGKKVNDVDISVIQREVTVYQKGQSVASFVLETQEVLKFVDRKGRIVQVVLIPKGKEGVEGDILVNGEAVESKEAENQLEIQINFSKFGLKIKMGADGEVVSF